MRPFVAVLAALAACAQAPPKPGDDTGVPADTDPADTDPADTDTAVDTADTDTDTADTDTADTDTDTADTDTSEPAGPDTVSAADGVKVHSVARVGDLGRIVRIADVTGDGRDDVVAATLYAESTNGGAFTLPGPVEASGAAEDLGWAVVGTRRGAGLGRSASVGDLDGDGIADVGLGVPYASEDGLVIVYGPHTSDVRDDDDGVAFLLGPRATLAGHGSDIGDVDGDGQVDAVVGAYSLNDGAGGVFVAYGPLTGDVDLEADADARVLGDEPSLNAGRIVSTAGDLDGDGTRDVVVGCLGSMGAPSSGGVFVVHGPLVGESALSDADGRYAGEGPSASAGLVLGAGDLDGDGLDDMLVTANDNTFAEAGGAVFVVYGPASDPDADLSVADVILRGDRRNQYGGGVAAEDIDGDGSAELFVGAAGDNTAARFAGAVYVFFDPAAGEYGFTDGDLLVYSEARDGQFGTGLAVGDVDGDAGFELVVGAPADSTAAINSGAVYVIDLPE